jgi:hypothetical protein
VLKKIKRRFGISARNMAVRTHIAWYWRWIWIVLFLGSVIALAVASYYLGKKSTDDEQSELATKVQESQKLVTSLTAENSELHKQNVESLNQARIDRASNDALAKQMKSLAGENATLKEDLAFFQTLLSSNDGKQGISINRFRLERDALPGEYKYRFHLLQIGSRLKEFDGKLQFVVNYELGGQNRVVLLPDRENKDEHLYQIKFKFYRMVEGGFKLDPKARVKDIQLKVLETGSGQIQASDGASLS